MTRATGNWLAKVIQLVLSPDNAKKGRQTERLCRLRERDKPLKGEIPRASPV
jgi:hypothetical protein